MLRITPEDGANRNITLRLEGRIVGPWVTELWKTCEKCLSEGLRLELDLAEVSFLEPAGVVLLSSLRSRGVLLTQCSTFVEAQLEAANSKVA
jgi:ABC-type transporter Mla MlaB component